jgi:cytochrome c
VRFASVLLLLLAIGCSRSMTPRVNTQEAVRSYVDGAAGVVAREGTGACTTLQTRWDSGDWYIFVLDAEGRTLCHPRPEQVGASVHDLVDVRGKRFGDEFLRVAGEGGGWVSYLWPRPGETETKDKTSYVRQVTGPDGKLYIVGSGGYALR